MAGDISDELLNALLEAHDYVALLARLLDVRSELTRWRDHADTNQGVIAANALDQALGLLEELAGGAARDLVEMVDAVLHTLPAPDE
jgi:hypothetical protein